MALVKKSLSKSFSAFILGKASERDNENIKTMHSFFSYRCNEIDSSNVELEFTTTH